MTMEDKMTIDERRKYLHRMKKRDLQANRKEKGRLLDEMEAVTELHRKSLIRLMNGSLERKPRSKQREGTTTDSSNRSTPPWFEPALRAEPQDEAWATIASTPSPRPSPSTSFTTRCGSTTTSSSR